MLFCFYVFNDYLRGRLWFFSKLYCLMCSKGFSLCKLRGKIKLLSANTSVRHSASSCSAPLFDRSMSNRSKRRPCTSLLSRAISRSRVNARCSTLLCPVYWSCFVRTWEYSIAIYLPEDLYTLYIVYVSVIYHFFPKQNFLSSFYSFLFLNSEKLLMVL